MELSSCLLARFTGFVRHEHGAVTVDWVVLTGAIVLLGVASAYYVGANVPVLADAISLFLSNTEVGPPS